MNEQCTAHWFAPVGGCWGRLIGCRNVWSLPLALVLAVILLCGIPASAAAAVLPADVPNIYDPAVRARFAPVMVTNLQGNPDFPMVLLVNTTGEQPEALLVGLDARNGTDTWSLTGDPIILIVAFAQETIQRLYVDTGFAGQGAASGNYAAVDDVNSLALPDLLRHVTEGATRTYI
jgi:hypothetical protein